MNGMTRMTIYLKALSAVALAAAFIGCGASDVPVGATPQEKFAHAMERYESEDYFEAIQEFEAITLQYPGSVVADDAQYYLGMARFKREEYLIAAYEFGRLIRTISGSEFVPDAQYMLGESYYQLSPPYPLDQEYTKKAIDELQAFVDFYPLDERATNAANKIVELNLKLAEKEFTNGVIYEKMDYDRAALNVYHNVAQIFHDTPFAKEAIYKRIQLFIDREETEDAREEIEEYLRRYDDERRGELEDLREELKRQSASR
ncbi:MAG: outer membrane protein assembly factor BamD [Ignavibacteriales bacterium]|nr:outer membrane protein assembly factor BamD [Ignavibacteriales bacterium]